MGDGRAPGAVADKGAIVVAPGEPLPPPPAEPPAPLLGAGSEHDGTLVGAPRDRFDDRAAERATLRGFTALVRVIGPPDVLGLGDIADRDRAVELACLMAMHSHRALQSEEVLSALWPSELGEPAVTTKRLTNVASSLRSGLGAELFPPARKGVGYRLEPEVGCDVAIFSELAAEVAGPLEREHLREALALVRGAPFEGVRAGTYVWAWNEHLVSTIGRVVREAAARYCRLSLAGLDHRGAIWGAMQGLLVDPYDGELWELYLTASAGIGRRGFEQAWKEARGVLADDASALRPLVERLRLELTGPRGESQ